VRSQATLGVLFAALAFGAWGLNPIYFKAVADVPPLEILAHRVLWSVPLLALLVTAARGWPGLREALSDRRTAVGIVISALILSVNWFIFIYAINSGQVLQSSLGYYMNPLLNVLLGMIFLKERLTKWQGLAVLLAATGVLNLAVQVGVIPWIALSLAGTFGVYGLIRKVIRLASLEGLFVETLLMLLPALGWIFYLSLTGNSHFLVTGWRTDILLLLAGPVTAVPLIWFASAARRLNYATIGLFQYIAPSCHFLLGVFLYDEPFGMANLVTFAFIWTALAIFSFDSLRHRSATAG
jgi:chloramphenicol-sensitive protein RarD